MEDLPKGFKKEISRLRSEVRDLRETRKDINPFTGLVSGNYWTQTGMPWITSEGRKAVLTEWFWQPIRGQPRRVDTNELRQFSQTFWVNSCVRTICDEITSMEWDIIEKEDYEYEDVDEAIKEVKAFLKYPNKNKESFMELMRAVLKDILEVDAGVIVKVFDVNSYDFEQLEPKSGAPLLKPQGQRKMVELYARDGSSFLKEVDKFGFCRGYWQYSYQIPAHPMWFDSDEICYINQHQRSMSCYGYAPTQAIMDIIKSLHYSTLYNKRFFEETPIPDGALALLDTNEVEMKAFTDYWNREFKGQPHKLAVINKDIKWLPFAVSQKELEFLETQKWYYKMVITIFGLTPAELGMTDDLNRATAATQAELARRKGIRPLMKLIESFINQQIIPELGYDGVEFQFVWDDPAERTMRLSNWKMELDMGLKTINEVRGETGLEPVSYGDVPNASIAMTKPNQNPEGSNEDIEDAEQGNYKETLHTEEGKPEEKSLKKILKPLPEEEADPNELEMGIEVEMEHTNDKEEAKKIALQHLSEVKDYYTRLKEIE